MPGRGWEIPEREATPEEVYLNRRRFLQAVGAAGLSAAGLLTGCDTHKEVFAPLGDDSAPVPPEDSSSLAALNAFYPAPLNPAFAALDRPLTEEAVAAHHNNFYEFSLAKEVERLAAKLTIDPWKVEVAGLVQKPTTYDIGDLVSKMPLEERLYRFRCVEAWAMAVPWTGFPLKALIDQVEPLSSARYVQMTTFFNPEEAPVQKALSS